MMTYEEYIQNGGKCTEDEFNKYINSVTMDINSLTFNRIDDFDKLTDFQKNIINKVIVDMIDFNVEYADVVDMPLNSYSINGVSMTWDNSKIENVDGVIIRTYALNWLNQTGLTCRVI
jgi:hypothetical protein